MIDFRNRTLLAAAIGAAMCLGAHADASAQAGEEIREALERQQQAEQQGEARDATTESNEPAVAKYPQATREEPETKASRRMSGKLDALIEAYNANQFSETRTQAAGIVADEEANNYERALAAQAAAQAAHGQGDVAATMASLQQAIEFDGLDNNSHYGAMLMLAQLQMKEGQEQQGLATLERFLGETRAQEPAALILKGETLYNMARYQEAAVVTRQAIDASPAPDPTWVQLLMGIYFELDQPQEAARIAEQLAASNPDDKRAQFNLAATYLQGDQMDKAAAVLEQVRASGQMTEERDYRQLYATYLNMEGKESEAIAVIEEGLAKGVLKPNHEVYLALAQSYYYSEQDDQAIEAYRKAAPLDDDGATYLNLAKVLWQADRIGEAKQAAQQALDKGIEETDDARQILALPAN